MYFIVYFQPTGERLIFQDDDMDNKLKVKDLLEWTQDHFHFESSSGETGNRQLSLQYNSTELQEQWFLSDIGISIGSTVKCVVREVRIPDYRLFLPIRNETFDVFDSNLHPIETTILQLRIVASNKSGLPLSAFRLINEKHNTLLDHVRLSQYDIDYRATLTMQTWTGWSDFYTYAMKGYTKAVLKLLSPDELVRQYMMQLALYIAAHYGNVDLARALLQIGARADHPVGHHPSRQWCSSDCVDPEYLRCPIHEAIICQQIGIVLLFGGRDVAILQQADGHGIKPWRLALRQPPSPKQHEIALFMLSKQFGGIRLFNKATVPYRHIYTFKKWAERARERVYIQHGVHYSSLKRKPLPANGESLLGYKVLIDGYNNDFQDFYSTAEYSKEKMRPACVVLNEREKIKLKNMENYMKNFNVNANLQGKSTPLDLGTTAYLKTVLPGPVQPEAEILSRGKHLWNKISNLYRLESMLLRNSIELIQAGMITDESSAMIPQPNNQKQRVQIQEPPSRISSSISSNSSSSLYFPIQIRLFASQYRLIKEMMYKPDKDGRTLRHLSGVEWAKVKRGQNNAWQTQRASTANQAQKQKKALKIKNDKKGLPVKLPEIIRTESSAKLPLPKELKKTDYRFILKGSDRLHQEIIYDWEKTTRISLPALSIQSLTEATQFKRKSWIRQVHMAKHFALNYNRRVFRGHV